MKIKHLAKIVDVQSRKVLVDNIEIPDIQKALDTYNETLSSSATLAPHCMPRHAIAIFTIHIKEDESV
jgi:hypothetical protein